MTLCPEWLDLFVTRAQSGIQAFRGCADLRPALAGVDGT